MEQKSVWHILIMLLLYKYIIYNIHYAVSYISFSLVYNYTLLYKTIYCMLYIFITIIDYSNIDCLEV